MLLPLRILNLSVGGIVVVPPVVPVVVRPPSDRARPPRFTSWKGWPSEQDLEDRFNPPRLIVVPSLPPPAIVRDLPALPPLPRLTFTSVRELIGDLRPAPRTLPSAPRLAVAPLIITPQLVMPMDSDIDIEDMLMILDLL